LGPLAGQLLGATAIGEDSIDPRLSDVAARIDLERGVVLLQRAYRVDASEDVPPQVHRVGFFERQTVLPEDSAPLLFPWVIRDLR
ncbi:MAG: hypothetical protein ACRDIC_17375, partial [bacterium]